MSKLMDDLKKLNQIRKPEVSTVVHDPEPPREVPAEGNQKPVYFIGILIVAIFAVSASSMAVALKTLARVGNVEAVTRSADAEILARLKGSQETVAALAKTVKAQEAGMKEMQALLVKQNEDALARADRMTGRLEEMAAALKERQAELEDLKSAQSGLKKTTEDSIADIQLLNKLMAQKYTQLDGQVKKLLGKDEYSYGSY